MIQRQARVMIARNNFRVCLYKLILLKNIIETKVHKEKMQMLFAFEQLIINTEDPETEVQADPASDPQDELSRLLEGETDPYLREQIMQLYNPLYKGMVDPEQYFQNTDDIINEEDHEESMMDEEGSSSPVEKSKASTPPIEKENDMKKDAAKGDRVGGKSW
jgi:hypothetical protein